MSIERFGDEFVPVCNVCGDQLEGQHSFPAAVDAKQCAGWKSRRVDGEWEDVCPCCQEEEAEDE